MLSAVEPWLGPYVTVRQPTVPSSTPSPSVTASVPSAGGRLVERSVAPLRGGSAGEVVELRRRLGPPPGEQLGLLRPGGPQPR